MNRKNRIRFPFRCAVALFVVCCGTVCTASDPGPASASPSYALTTQSFLETYDRILKTYVYDVTPERLLTLAVGEMLADVTGAPAPAELLVFDPSAAGSARAQLNAFTAALRTVQRRYRPQAPLHELLEDAVAGMVDSLGDPYSRYMKPEEHHELSEYISGERGQYVGVGIHIGLDRGVVTVVRPIEGSPAYERGINAGDRIVAVDGEDVRGVEVLEDVVARIKGPEGTIVVLTIERNGLPETIDFDIVRRPVTPKNVDYQMVTDRVGWIRLYTFSQNAVAEVRHALHVLEMSGAEALVLDLRHNPGGLLEAAVGVSDLFLPQDAVIVVVKGRDPLVHRRETSAFPPVWNKPVTVLVDGASASASEIVTGALKDHGRATVLGETTFGKGSVQQVFVVACEISGNLDHPALRLSTALYYTPSGTCINHVGIAPDIAVEYEKPEPDPVATAVPEGEPAPPTPTPDPRWWIRRDNQLRAAIDYVDSNL